MQSAIIAPDEPTSGRRFFFATRYAQGNILSENAGVSTYATTEQGP
jgi:hypothetical protein